MDRPYATPEGILGYLGSIEGLHALREDRRTAAARFERLPPYCVLGRWLLTDDGRFGELVGASLEAALETPDVIALDAFERMASATRGSNWRLTYRTPAPIASSDGVCEGCGRGWTLADCHDVEEDYVRDRILAFHPACLDARRRGDWLWWADDVLERSGFADDVPALAEGPVIGFPWFRLDTRRGGIRFGKLPPGFAITWEQTGQDLSGIFCRRVGAIGGHVIWSEPPVDHGRFHVYPLDEAYLVRYLSRLREALGL